MKVVIEYITLDSRFDRVRTFHFVLLNHFRHKVKISFTFYLYTSMCKALSSFKKKPFVNPALYEGLLLLIHEHFKALSLSKPPSLKSNVDASGSSRFSLDSNDTQSISSAEEDFSDQETERAKMKVSTPSFTHKRKSLRGHGKKLFGKDEIE